MLNKQYVFAAIDLETVHRIIFSHNYVGWKESLLLIKTELVSNVLLLNKTKLINKILKRGPLIKNY